MSLVWRAAVATAVLMTLPAGPRAVEGQEPHTLRVMSYNIKHGQTNDACKPAPREPGQPPAPDCSLDLQAAIDVIRTHAPDIAGVQEVDRFWARSAHVDQPAAIADGLGMSHRCYAPNLDHPADAHSSKPHQYGTLIVSRHPIRECTHVPLRRVGDGEQRGLLAAVVDIGGVALRFYTTHLHTAQADRLLQSEDIGAAIDAAPAGPKVLVGDFNARGAADGVVSEMKPIYARLTDAWRAAPMPDPDNPQGLTSPALLDGPPRSRIDYIFVSPDIQVKATRVPIDAKTRRAADHYPVVAEIVLPGPGRLP